MNQQRPFNATRRRALLSLALLVPAGRAFAAGAVVEALKRPAMLVRRPEQSVMLGAVTVDSKVVAVGERGIILISGDAGRSWRQVNTPVSVTLTAVRFADARNGVAVGHGATILTTSDGGETWTLRMDGRRAATLLVDAAKSSNDPAALRDAERMLAEGPDRPLFDVLMSGPSNLLAVGSYGLILSSTDGGASWTPWNQRLENPKGLHYYAIRQQGETLLIAGEAGIAFCSEDAGKSFRRLETPYRGSYFTAELTAEREIVLAGLRGNIWRSRDLGKTWQQLTSPMPASITASLLLADGHIVFANQAGYLLDGSGESLLPINDAPLPPLNGFVRVAEQGYVVLTVQGLMLVAPNQSAKAKS